MSVNVQALDTMPWYKYQWPWFLMIVPVLTVIAGFITFYLALATSDGVVEDDYYKRGLAVNEDKARDHKALDLRVSAQVMVGEREVRVAMASENGGSFPEHLVLHFRHATRPGFDQAIDLKNDGVFYAGTMEPLVPGKWRLSLEDATDDWRLLGVFNPANDEAAHLLPFVPAGDAASMSPADS